MLSSMLLGVVSITVLLLNQQAAQAAPADGAVLLGSAPVPTTAPSTVTVTYRINVTGTIGATVLMAHEPTELPADPTSVQVDGVTAPAGTVSTSGPGLAIRLGTGADANDGGQLTGTHSVSFAIAVATLPTGNTSASAELDYTAVGVAATAASPLVPLARPDLTMALPPFSGEEHALPLGTAVDGDFEAILTNSGGSTPAATLTIALPAGLTVDEQTGVYRDDDYRNGNDDGGVPLTCTAVSASQVSCVLGAVPHGTNSLLDIPVQATPSAPVGQTAHFTVSALADTGQDADPSDNSVGASVIYTGTANLTLTLTPSATKVVVGKKVAITAKIVNAGPQPALDAMSIIALDSEHFTIVKFSGPQLPFETGDGSADLAALHRNATGVFTSSGTPLVLWNVRTIAPGHAKSAVATLRAVSVGKTDVVALAISEAGQPSCEDVTSLANCTALVTIKLRAITAPVAKPAPTPTSSGPTLAATGPPDAGILTTTGLLCVLVGALVVALGTVRRGSRHSF